jgi:predicted nucleotidyltransferase
MSGICATTDIDPRLLERLNCPLEEIAKLCEKFQVSELSVFGSAVRDDFRQENSDIDFLYEFCPNASIGVLNWRIFTKN